MATHDIDLTIQMNGEPFLALDPHKDIEIGSFVTMCSPEAERKSGTTFYIDKVRALNCVVGTWGMVHKRYLVLT